MEPIEVTLKADQIGDLVFQQLEDDAGDEVGELHARFVIDSTIKALDALGLIVRRDDR